VRWFRRHSGDPDGDARDRLVDAISRIRRDQRAVEASLGVAVVDAATLDRALRDQRELLDAAAQQIADARAVAQRAADGAAADGGDVAAAPYRLAVDGFAAQQRVVEASGAQLERLGSGAADNVARTRQLLRESAASLDGALRAEVDLLARLERLERDRTIAETHRTNRDNG
jgi:hypothetical protein